MSFFVWKKGHTPGTDGARCRDRVPCKDGRLPEHQLVLFPAREGGLLCDRHLYGKPGPEGDLLCGGDGGDAYAEGIAHLLFAAKRNVNMTVLVHNNRVYGLTKGAVYPPHVSRRIPQQIKPAGYR